MAYSDFNLPKLKKAFGLQVNEQVDLFCPIVPIPASDYLRVTLDETVTLAIAINTEKARSEMIITPVLLEVRRQADATLSLFSGSEFNVDQDLGLVGYCDYLLSRSPAQLTINAPVAVVVEAKNENIKGGLGQCVATMYAAQLFNQRESLPTVPIYGAVTTGEIWKFLKLIGQTVAIDLNDYYVLRDLDQILGILLECRQVPVGTF